jgi:RNA chaperone Hfq
MTYPAVDQLPRHKVMSPTAPKGHDAVLKALQTDKRSISIRMMSGEWEYGTVVARDKFTITVLRTNNVRVVLFKHAIESFYGAERPAKAVE